MRESSTPEIASRWSGWAYPAPDRWALPLAILLLGLATIPRLPRGPCLDDSGDLQATSLELGVAHAPGYVGYVTFGWLITRLGYPEPAFTITLTCCASGLIALWLCGRVQIVLGAHPVAAGAAVLLCALHPAVQNNLVLPEVYAPTAALLVGALLQLAAYSADGRGWRIFVTALLLGIAVSNRTPAALVLPGFLIGAWVAIRRRSDARGAAARHMGMALLVGALPCLYAVGYLWLRGAPGLVDSSVVENLIDVGEGGAAARWRGVVRCLTGADYALPWSTSWHSAYARADWVFRNGVPRGGVAGAALLVPLCVLGFVRIARRAPAAAWALAGLFIGSAALLVLVHTEGTATDYLPPVLVAGICAGVGVAGREAPAIRRQLLATRYTAIAAGALAVALSLARLPQCVREADAGRFLGDLELRTLPANTILAGAYDETTALRYARTASGRQDIAIVRLDPARKGHIVERLVKIAEDRRRPLFFTTPPVPPAGWHVVPQQNSYTLTR